MPADFEGLQELLRGRNIPIVNLDWSVERPREGVPPVIRLEARTLDRTGTFEFRWTDSTEDIARSIELAFPRYRLIVPLHEIPGAISLTYNENPSGAAYDYGPGGVTLDRESVPRPLTPIYEGVSAEFRVPGTYTEINFGEGTVPALTLASAGGTDLDRVGSIYGFSRDPNQVSDEAFRRHVVERFRSTGIGSQAYTTLDGISYQDPSKVDTRIPERATPKPKEPKRLSVWERLGDPIL